MAGYSYITFAQARTQLAAMLDDYTNVQWTDAELGIYIVEALRTWGIMAMYWRERGAFNTTSGTAFYPLGLKIPTLFGPTVTDTNLMTEIQYMLLEPPTGTSWTGSDQFTFQQVTDAIQRANNEFRLQSGFGVEHITQVAAPAPFGRFTLSDDIVDIRRMAWLDNTNTFVNVIWRTSEWAMGAATAMTWVQNPGTPATYSVTATPPLTVQLQPPPIATGSMDLVALHTGPNLNPATGVLLEIPDDFTPVVKWRALSILLGGDGQAYDPLRADYCEQRWQEGIKLSQLYSSVMQLQLNDVPIYVSSLQALDSANPTWQAVTGQPTIGALASVHQLVLSPVPNGSYGVSADVIRKAPVPVLDGDFIQVGREELNTILRYAQHLATFKEGGQEFTETRDHYVDMLFAAQTYNERLLANAEDFDALWDRNKMERERRPRRVKAEDQQPVGV